MSQIELLKTRYSHFVFTALNGTADRVEVHVFDLASYTVCQQLRGFLALLREEANKTNPPVAAKLKSLYIKVVNNTPCICRKVVPSTEPLLPEPPEEDRPVDCAVSDHTTLEALCTMLNAKVFTAALRCKLPPDAAFFTKEFEQSFPTLGFHFTPATNTLIICA